MSEGELLAFILLGFLFLWGFADYLVWRSGRETMSQWVIDNVKARSLFRWGVFAVLTILYLWLCWHWEIF